MFDVRVSDGLITVLSDPASLNPLITPTILQALPAVTTALQGDTVSWTVSVSGFPMPFNFQWRRGVITILTNQLFNATNCTFTLFYVQPSHSGSYRVIVTNLATPSDRVLKTRSRRAARTRIDTLFGVFSEYKAAHPDRGFRVEFARSVSAKSYCGRGRERHGPKAAQTGGGATQRRVARPFRFRCISSQGPALRAR